MFNPNQTGNDAGETDENGFPMDQPFDYYEHAKKLRLEREVIEANKKLERDAKESAKKTEKAERVVKKMADKAKEDLEKKVDKVAEKTGDAKELITEARDEVAEIRDELSQKAEELGDTLPAPIETVVMSNGSEISSELEKGEQMIMEIQHSTDKLIETVSLADEVAAQAEAIASARAALESVDSEAIGVSYSGQEDNSQVFGEDGPQEDIRDRLRHAWELPLAHPDVANIELPNVTNISEPGLEVYMADASDIKVAPVLAPYSAQSEYRPFDEVVSGNYGANENTVLPALAYEKPRTDETEEYPAMVTKVSSGLKTGAAFLGGLFAGRSQSTKNALEQTNTVLRNEITDLSREVQAIQTQPFATHEVGSIPAYMQTPGITAEYVDGTKGTSEQLVSHTEVRGTNEPAIPEWIKQVDRDLQKGKVIELKKWQLDVLRAQHPDLLKRYERLDGSTKEQIIKHSKESILAPFNPQRSVSLPLPGDLPSPVLDSMPAFMRPITAPVPQPIMPPSAYEYAVNKPSSTSTFSSAYITNVLAGGLLLGAVLIAIFGF